MKTLIIPLLAATALAGCFSNREIQVEMVNARLVRIDTIHRYSESEWKKQLTWRDNQNMEYISYAPLQAMYSVGTTMAVLRSR